MDLIQHLPAETLSDIFSHCTVDIGFDPGYPFESYDIILNQAPHSLTRVSSRWRSITLTSPRSWTSLSLPLLPKTPEAIELFFTELQTWLKRSGVLPLSFRVYISAYFLGSTKQTYLAQSRPYIERYMHILAEHSSRWLDVCSNLSYTRVFPDIHPFPDLSSTPLLRSFAMYAPLMQPRRRGNDNQVILSRFNRKNAPHLCRVYLDHLLLTQWVLPWTHLRKLHMHTQAWGDDFDAEVLMRNLKKCARLEELNIDFVSVKGPPRHSRGRRSVVLPSLRRLEANLGGAKDRMFHYFFDTLETPRLEHLILTSGDHLNLSYTLSPNSSRTYLPVELRAALVKFVGHCEDALKELELVDDVKVEVLVMVLEKLKNLEVLNIPSHTLALRVFEYLISPSSNESTSSLQLQSHLGSGRGISPALKELQLQGHILASDWDAPDRPRESSFANYLARLVESRAVSRSSLDLQAFKIRLWRSLRERMREGDPEAYDRLEVLQSEGKLRLESINA